MEKPNRKLNTPLGELIAAAGQVAFECSDNDKDAYILAQLALIEMIKKTSASIRYGFRIRQSLFTFTTRPLIPFSRGLWAPAYSRFHNCELYLIARHLILQQDPNASTGHLKGWTNAAQCLRDLEPATRFGPSRPLS